jgi:hypothetical protein
MSTMHYDQADSIAIAKSQLNKTSDSHQPKIGPTGPSDGKPTFEIDNTKNVMLLMGAATDTRVIVETFLQANVRMRSKYKCTMLHCCTRENKITHDSYYIVKNII